MESDNKTVAEKVRDFYAAESKNCGFKTNVNYWDLNNEQQQIVKKLHPETMRRYYGSGFMIPEKIEGAKILDIGCGSGSLVYVLSQLVGKDGHVTGIDITSDLINLCSEYSQYHSEISGYGEPNFEFLCGQIENMSEQLKFAPNSFDIIVSNGVFCLIENKAKAFSETYKILKEGGEFLLSDVYAEKTVAEECKDDLKMWSLGLTGSQVWQELDSAAQAAGFTRPYVTLSAPVDMSEEYTVKFKGNKICCAGSRLFKLPKGAQHGPAQVTYRGNIKGCEQMFRWDISLTFQTGKPVDVDAELATVLHYSRFKDCFSFKSIQRAKTNRAQNPFRYIEEQADKGNPIPFAYRVE